jgi:PhzF family phenazine biosynthesis protein
MNLSSLPELPLPRHRPFQQVDVFATRPYTGNPLAVVLDGTGLSDNDMQRFARWTNLSETTFLLPVTDTRADYRVRIFTASTELPFAGHPTLGSCHAWLHQGNLPKGENEIVQECAVGLVRIRRSNDTLAFAAPPLIRSGPLDSETLAQAAHQLQIDVSEIVDSQWIDNGPGWIGVVLHNAEAVMHLKPSPVGQLKIGAVGTCADVSEFAVVVRAFYPSADGTVFEDPVTGSLNASLAQWLLGSGRLQSPYVASQGTAIGRAGRVAVEQLGEDIWIGGRSVTCIEGTVLIADSNT